MAEKITSWDGLKQLRSEIKKKTAADSNHTVIAVGMATCGVAAGADVVMETLRRELDETGLKNVTLAPTGCYGFCYAEPMVEVREPGAPPIKYGYVDEKMAVQIVRKHILKGELLPEAILGQEVQKA